MEPVEGVAEDLIETTLFYLEIMWIPFYYFFGRIPDKGT